MVSKRTKPGCLLPLISSQERILFLALGLGICKHHPLHAKHTEARETPWSSEITNEWALQACRSATALGKRNGPGETQRLHPMNRTMVRAIRKLGRRRCRVPTKCRSAAHTEREKKRDGRSDVDITTEVSALIRLLTPKAGWDGGGHVRDLCSHIYSTVPAKPRIVVRKEKRICTSA
ncbi:hypothetical protein NW760_001113 [Fusarium oxysporum]|nr:hypothetical protein NW753_007734 [Fusarium oxysporum]KAJ4114217.1 hypothetical protein NW769_005000 [Fusarium oxysporum]KAJ4240832.1 hypothetical protein NW760_001113 [Fusarium oxysporum]